MIKYALLLTPIIIISEQAHSQQTSSFKEKTFLWLKDNTFRTVKNDTTIYLMYVNNKDKVINNTLTYTGKFGSKSITFYQVDTAVNYENGTKLDASLTDSFTFPNKILYGDFKQDKDVLYFYPWDFPKKDSILNHFLSTNKFFLKIPERTVVRVSYRGWQFGTLTLPIKVYLGSKADTIKNNIDFSANFNFMIGFKWGKEKFYYLPNEAEGESYLTSWSFNFISGVSKLDIDNTNTTPKAIDTYSVAALSYGFALGYQYKKIGVFLATGLDTPLSKFGKNWNFGNRPWIGFGLGLGL